MDFFNFLACLGKTCLEAVLERALCLCIKCPPEEIKIGIAAAFVYIYTQHPSIPCRSAALPFSRQPKEAHMAVHINYVVAGTTRSSRDIPTPQSPHKGRLIKIYDFSFLPFFPNIYTYTGTCRFKYYAFRGHARERERDMENSCGIFT